MGAVISISLFSDVSSDSLVFAAVAGLIGYIIGGQLKSAIKIALIIS
ncbi:MAG: hypothetical protein QXH03_10090 [Candidatus Bathyarchaeia archaeon]